MSSAPRAGTTVLLSRFSTFGDVLLTLPIAEALLANEDIGGVDLLTSREFSTVVKRSGRYRKVYEVDLETGAGADGLTDVSYDYLLDLHARRGPLPEVAERLVGSVRATTRVGYGTTGEGPSFDISLESRRNDEHAVHLYARAAASLTRGPLGSGVVALSPDLAELAGELPGEPVCLTPGARFDWKRWPETHYAELARSLRSHGFSPVVVGHPFDAALIDRIAERVPGVATVVSDDELRLLSVIGRCGISVGNNSGLMHLAQVAGAKVVCVHSHTLPAMWRPWGSGHRDVTGNDLHCDCADLTEYERLAPCGQNIPVAPVLAAALELCAVRGRAPSVTSR